MLTHMELLGGMCCTHASQDTLQAMASRRVAGAAAAGHGRRRRHNMLAHFACNQLADIALRCSLGPWHWHVALHQLASRLRVLQRPAPGPASLAGRSAPQHAQHCASCSALSVGTRHAHFPPLGFHPPTHAHTRTHRRLSTLVLPILLQLKLGRPWLCPSGAPPLGQRAQGLEPTDAAPWQHAG